MERQGANPCGGKERQSRKRDHISGVCEGSRGLLFHELLRVDLCRGREKRKATEDSILAEEMARLLVSTGREKQTVRGPASRTRVIPVGIQ